MLLDGSESIKLSDFSSRYIDMNLNRLFFSNLQDHGYLYSMDFSGKHLHKMNQEESWMVTYCNGWIYFISKSDCLRIKRISENGLKTETLVQDDCISFKIYKDVLYFSNHNHNNSLFSYHLKNKELNWIHPDSCWNFLIYQDQIFYMNATKILLRNKLKMDNFCNKVWRFAQNRCYFHK